jgi:hypothetical protein
MGGAPPASIIGPAGAKYGNVPSCTPPPVSALPTGTEFYGTWYGVQSSASVTIDMWEKNAAAIIAYLSKKTIPWTGVFIHVEPPAAGTAGKASNPYSYPIRIAQMIATLPPGIRVGLQATVEQDSIWALSPAGVATKYQYPGNADFPFYGPVNQCDKYGGNAFCQKEVGPGAVCAPDGVCAECVPGPSDTCPTGYTCLTASQRCVPDAYFKKCIKNPPPPPIDPATVIPTPVGSALHSQEWCSTKPVDNNGNPTPVALYGGSDPLEVGSSDCACLDSVSTVSGSLIFTTNPALPTPSGFNPTLPAALMPSAVAGQGPVWYGGSGMAGPASAVGPTGSPYQARTAGSYAGQNACPYKLGSGDSWPEGCPNNMSHTAWYATVLNYYLGQLGSSHRITMMNWDAEGNGADGLTCSIFQFVYGLRQFYAAAGPAMNNSINSFTSDLLSQGPFLLFQNGGPGLTTATATPGKGPCAEWADVSMNLNPAWGALAGSSAPKTFGDFATFVPAPEYYWFEGQDMGGVADGGAGNGMAPALAAAGYIGCPQSKSTSVGFNSNCGCTQSVYETYAHEENGGTALVLDVLGPTVYDTYLAGAGAGAYKGISPTFSIEHLGSPTNMLSFGRCINSQNFPKQYGGTAPELGCAADGKCAPRCGVANFFGNWTEECFIQFLFQFAITYGPAIRSSDGKIRIGVYDLGFLPPAWMPVANPPWGSFPPDMSGSVGGQIPASVAALNSLPTNKQRILWTETCPVGADGATLFNCLSTEPTASGPAWNLAPAGGPGNPLAFSLKCYDCTKDCAFTPNGAGVATPTNTTYRTPADCAGTKTCGKPGPFPAGGSGSGSASGSGSGSVPPGPSPPGPSPPGPFPAGGSGSGSGGSSDCVLVCKNDQDGRHYALGGGAGHAVNHALGGVRHALAGVQDAVGGAGGGGATGVVLQAIADRVCGPSVKPYKNATIGLSVTAAVFLALFIVFLAVFLQARRK